MVRKERSPIADRASTGRRNPFEGPQGVEAALQAERYLADGGLSTAVYLAAELEQPLLLEGEAGVGKTEVAKALAAATGAHLIRLQCHEGIDLHHAVYDWDYARQLLALRAAEGGGEARELFTREFLLRRPLLDALEIITGPLVASPSSSSWSSIRNEVKKSGRRSIWISSVSSR